MPPTIRLSKGEVNPNQTSTISGKSIPGVKVRISVFSKKESTPLSQILVPPAYAAESTEALNTETSTDGSFTTNIQSATTGSKRVFAQAVYNSHKTPKSTTLTLNILSLWLLFVDFLIRFFSPLFTLNAILFTQLLLLLWLVARRARGLNWLPLYHRKQRAIVLFKLNKELLVVNYTPVERELLEKIGM